MTEQERKAKDAQRKREAYRRRKEAQAELSNKLPLPEEAAIKPAKAHGIDVPPPNSKERAEAVMADSTARAEYVQLLFSPYAKSTNLPELLQGLIREQIETRIVMVDMLAEILENTRK